MDAKKKPAKKKPAKKSAGAPSDSVAQFEKLLKKAKKEGHYVLKLYVTGTTPRSTQAVASVHALCEEYLQGRYDLQVIDIYQQPKEAAGQQIIAAPTLVKQFPMPATRMIGDLSNRQKVLVGLDLVEKSENGSLPKAKTKWANL